MYQANLLILLLLGTCGSQAKIVNQIDPNQFELELEERGTRLTQKIRFDVDGLRITEVPAHNELVAATYVYDSSKNLQMNVVPAHRSCYLHVPIFSPGNEYERNILDSVSRQDDEETDFLKVEHGQTMTLELIDVIGPELDRESIPSNLKKYCPEDFQAFAMKQVQNNPRTVHNNSDNELLIGDARLQKDMNFGDNVDFFSDLFQLMPTVNRRSSRVKRACRTADGSINVDSCSWIDDRLTCELGCSAEDTFFNCRDAGTQPGAVCEYWLLCNRVMPNAGPCAGQCLAHVTHGGRICDPCCRARDCGSRMRMCNKD